MANASPTQLTRYFLDDYMPEDLQYSNRCSGSEGKPGPVVGTTNQNQMPGAPDALDERK